MSRSLGPIILALSLAFAVPSHAQVPETAATELPYDTTSKADLNNYRVRLVTSFGDIEIDLFPHFALGHVRNFLNLSKLGLYGGTAWHRIVPGFVIQGGAIDTRLPPVSPQDRVRFVRRLAFVAVAGVAAIAALLARGELSTGDIVITVLLLAPPALLVFFAQGLRELLALPERLRKLPGEGQERLDELARIAGDARTTRARGMPLLLWRLRGSVGSLRDVAGLALPLRVFTPGFLGLTALAALACLVLAGAGLVSLFILVAD